MSIEKLALALGTLHVEDRWRVSQTINGIAPAHWSRVRLHEVATVQNGFPFESKWFNSSTGMPLIRIRDVGADDTETFYSADYDNAFIVHPGDILVGMDGEFRCRRWRGRIGLLNQRVCRIRFSTPDFDERFAFMLLQPYLLAVQYATSSLTVAHLSSKTVEQLELLLPPLAEQKRIVSKVEELTLRSRRAKEALDAVPPLLDQLRQSILAAAFRGDLTADWRAKNPNVEPADKLIARIRTERRARWEAAELAKLTAKGKRPTDDRWKARYVDSEEGDGEGAGELPASWAWSSLGELFEVGVGATPSRAEASYWCGDVPWVSSGEVAFCRISSTRERITENGLVSTSTEVHPAGTVLIGMIGEGKTRGQAAILDIPACNNQNSAAIRVSETPIPPEYVYQYLALVYEQTRRVGSGNNQQALNKSRVQALSIPVAPVDEQRDIVRRLGLWLEKADAVEAAMNDGLERITALDHALLAKAFRGELVSQDPNDEPASVLIERIRAARDSADAGGARRRRRKSEAVVDAPDKGDDDDGTDALASPSRSTPGTRAAKDISNLDPNSVLDEVFAALWTRGPLEKDAAVRQVAEHLRDAGHVEFQRLRSDGPLYAQVLGFIEAAVKAGRLDRPKRGQVRACKPDAATYTADDWRLALVTSLGAEPVDRDEAIRVAAEWARDNLGLEFSRLRSDGHIVLGLRSALNSAIRRGEVTRHDATRISRAASDPQQSLPGMMVAKAGGDRRQARASEGHDV